MEIPVSPGTQGWGHALWTDTYSGQEFAISTSVSTQPGVVRVRSLADVLAEFRAHDEAKSATANGDIATAGSRGLLSRRHVTPSEVRLIGKESNAVEAVEAGLIGDWAVLLNTYGDRMGSNVPSLALLMSAPATVIAKLRNVTTRTVRAWRRAARSHEAK